MSLQKTPIPVLDLRELAQEEREEALRGFLWKHSEHFRHVIVRDTEGVGQFTSTAYADREKSIEALLAVKRLAPDDAECVVTDPLNVRQTFLELTAYTCPHGNEFKLYDRMLQELGWARNGRGNYWQTVGDGSSKTLFVAHLDTADRGKPKEVVHDTEGDFVGTDGTTLLGADDKAGVAVLLYLAAKGVPGDYLFVIGEECGCIGSGEEALHLPVGKYDRAIAFDRQGKSEVITHQIGQRTASKQFARALCKELRRTSKGKLELQPSDRGMYTDTNEFVEKIPECTNVAIGYSRPHSVFEVQDLEFLQNMAEACASVNWETLPTVNPVRRRFNVNVRVTPLDDEEENYIPWDQDSITIGNKSMWELWAAVDEGSYTESEVRTWVVYNPHRAAAILKRMIEQHSTEVLDILTEVGDTA